MPPSGYTTSQAKLIAEFLQSCADSLEREAAKTGRPLEQALAVECDNIRTALVTLHNDAIAVAVLNLTGALYEHLREGQLDEVETFRANLATALSLATNSIESIHVEPL